MTALYEVMGFGRDREVYKTRVRSVENARDSKPYKLSVNYSCFRWHQNRGIFGMHGTMYDFPGFPPPQRRLERRHHPHV